MILKELAPWILYIAWCLAFVISLTGRVKYGLFFLVPLIPLQNVVIGNIKIGANAVVVSDIPDDSTAVGIPAKIQRSA